MRNRYLVVYSVAALLASSSANAMQVVSGGVGETSEAALEQIEEKFNLKAIFTGDRGMYLSDVAVIIKDKDGNEVASGTTSGPILLAELTPGTYTLHSNKDGVEKKRTLKLNGDLRTYHITFPIKDEPIGDPMKIAPLSKQKHNAEKYTVGERVEHMEEKK